MLTSIARVMDKRCANLAKKTLLELKYPFVSPMRDIYNNIYNIIQCCWTLKLNNLILKLFISSINLQDTYSCQECSDILNVEI